MVGALLATSSVIVAWGRAFTILLYVEGYMMLALLLVATTTGATGL